MLFARDTISMLLTLMLPPPLFFCRYDATLSMLPFAAAAPAKLCLPLAIFAATLFVIAGYDYAAIDIAYAFAYRAMPITRVTAAFSLRLMLLLPRCYGVMREHRDR